MIGLSLNPLQSPELSVKKNPQLSALNMNSVNLLSEWYNLIAFPALNLYVINLLPYVSSTRVLQCSQKRSQLNSCKNRFTR